MDELRDINPNPTAEQYEREKDILIRRFCIEQAIQAKSVGIEYGTLTEAAKDIYGFITGTS